MRPEAKIWQRIKDKLPWKQVCRIENIAGVGIPDIYGHHDGRANWMELKHVYKAGKITPEDIKKALRPSQVIWHRKHREAGGRVFVLASNLCGDHALFISGEEPIEILYCKDRLDYGLLGEALIK